ncbi:hypothetical protein [Dysosmobacter sp.]
MKRYFGSAAATVTTLLLLVLIAFVVSSIAQRHCIHCWGRRSLFFVCCGLLTCCFAAARDGLDKTIQCAIDGSCAPGIFPLVSVPNLIGCIGAGVIILAGAVTLFIRPQQAREWLFFLMCAGGAVKIAAIETARMLL